MPRDSDLRALADVTRRAVDAADPDARGAQGADDERLIAEAVRRQWHDRNDVPRERGVAV